MAKKPAKSTSSFSLKYKEKAKVSRPGVHAKNKDIQTQTIQEL